MNEDTKLTPARALELILEVSERNDYEAYRATVRELAETALKNREGVN